jgi:GNAT superfamily N-acetyltransferase
MNHPYSISRATPSSAEEVARMVGELLHEIMVTIGNQAFRFDFEETLERLLAFIKQEKYFVFVAHTADGKAIGFVSIYESYALYAEGAFGTIPELFVRPQYRSSSVGTSLVQACKELGAQRGWRRIEVTTPPLPEFDRTLNFYLQHGFSISGGRKLKCDLEADGAATNNEDVLKA